MSRGLLWALATVLAILIPASASAAGREGGGARSAGGPVVRSAPAAPPQRAAPPPRPASPPQTRPATGGGFNFNRDIAPQRPVVQQPQPRQAVQQPRPRPVAQRPVAVPHTAPAIRFHGPTVANPQHWNGSWTWNRGVAWRPAPTYWGGGFWGPWALGALAGAVLFGAVVDASSQTPYPSYQVEPDSPGAELLQNYGLQQTLCGPPDLVVIWGPDSSVICAVPNATVGPGEYQLDPATLTLTSASP